MNDCKSLAEILTMFNDLIVNSIGGCIGLTTSSTALRTFRKKFLKITLPTYFPWNPFIRQGYYGGRCEVYIMYAPLCGKAYNYVDFNSMYASVMECNEFPISRPKRSVVKDPWDTAGRCGFMECSVETPEDLDIPLLPYRDVGNHNKLLFPLGNWRAVYEYSLIEKALKLGHKIKPHRCIEFKSDFLFKDYVNTMNHIKETNTGALRAIAKLLNNGLYGKFAEKSERDILVTEPHADIRGTFPLPNDVFGFTVKKIERLCAHHLPGISARVTALAMIKLYTEGFEYVKARKGRIFYCDTDSMVVDCKVPTSNRLGAWKLEAEITRAIFFGPKAYCYEYMGKDGELHIEQKIKGFSRPFTKTLTFDDFLRALPPMNDYHVFNEISMSPSSFKEINTRDLCGFSTVVKNRSIKEGYSKRVVDENLYTTKPLLIIG